MAFKSLTLYRFPVMPELTLERLATALPSVKARPCAGFERETLGFTSPFSSPDGEPLLALGDAALLVAAGEEKQVPRSVLDARVRDALAMATGTPSAAKRRQIRQNVEDALLAETLARPYRMNCVIDLANGWFGVDTSSGRRAETAVAAVRMAIRSFPTRPLTPMRGTEKEMTRWLIAGEAPVPFSFGEDCDLANASQKGALWRGRKIDVLSDEVRGHLEQSFHVSTLEIRHENGVSFRLDGNVRLVNIKSEAKPDAGLYRGAQSEDDQLVAEVAAEWALLRDVLCALDATFGLPRPGARA